MGSEYSGNVSTPKYLPGQDFDWNGLALGLSTGYKFYQEPGTPVQLFFLHLGMGTNSGINPGKIII